MDPLVVPFLSPPRPRKRAAVDMEGEAAMPPPLQGAAKGARTHGEDTIAPWSCRYEDEDLWTEVVKHLHGTVLARLSATSRWFRRLAGDEFLWKCAFRRDLLAGADIASSVSSPCSWRLLYAAVFGYFRRQEQQRSIDWLQIGGILLQSSRLLLAGTLALPPRLPMSDDAVRTQIEESGACMVTPARPGIWITESSLVRGRVSVNSCSDLNRCQDTRQVWGAHHCDLILENFCNDGTWDLQYQLLGQHTIEVEADTATAAVLDAEELDSQSTACVMDTKSWFRRRQSLEPKTNFTPHMAVVNSNLLPNQGLLSKFEARRDMAKDGQIVSVRISQQLL